MEALLRYLKKLLNLGLWLIVSFLCLAFLDTASSFNKKAGNLYQQKRYESALETYRKAEVRDPDRPEIRYNVGTTLYQLDHFQEAESQLKEALANAKTKDLRADAWYNYGNSEFRLGQFDKAIEAYKNTLEQKPDDQDAKFNLELLQKKKSLFNKKQDKRDEERKNQQPKPRQQNQKNQKEQSPQEGEGQKQEQKPNPSQGAEQKEQSAEKENGEPQKNEEQKDLKGLDGEAEKNKEEKGGEKQSESKGENKEENKPEEHPQPARPEPSQNEKKEAGEEPKQATQPLYQGQMSKQDALRILDALRDSEQQLQILRRPQEHQSEHEPEKDW